MDTSRNRLVDFPELLLVLVKYEVLGRVKIADDFIHFIHSQISLDQIKMTDVLHHMPMLTTIDNLAPSFYGGLYASVSFREGTPYDAEIPTESVAAFLDFALSHPGISAGSWFIALVYIDRIAKLSDGRILLHSGTVFRLFSVALMVASKFHEEKDVSVSIFADLAYCSKDEMIQLEVSFIRSLSYNLFVNDEDLWIAQVGLASAVLNAMPDGRLAKSLFDRRVDCVGIACTLVSAWNASRIAKDDIIPIASAYPLVRADSMDDIRIAKAITSIAHVQIQLEFGVDVNNIGAILFVCDILAMYKFDRLLGLVRMGRAFNRISLRSQCAHDYRTSPSISCATCLMYWMDMSESNCSNLITQYCGELQSLPSVPWPAWRRARYQSVLCALSGM